MQHHISSQNTSNSDILKTKIVKTGPDQLLHKYVIVSKNQSVQLLLVISTEEELISLIIFKLISGLLATVHQNYTTSQVF